MNSFSMDDSVAPSWFPLAITLIALAQTLLLGLACWLVYEWCAKLNRKLHRIESNTRHTAEPIVPGDEDPD